MAGVVNEVPLPRVFPPFAVAYQLIVPEETVAPSVTIPASHLAAAMDVRMVGSGLMVTLVVTVVLHPALLVTV